MNRLSVGVVRKTDSLGRIVLPKEIRINLDIKENDHLEIFIDGDMLELRKYAPYCMACGKTRKVVQVGNIKLCEDCIRDIKNRL